MTQRTPTERALRWVRRGVIFVLGASITLIGVLMVFTPGPAIVVVPIGLMILATEFAWAKVMLDRVKARIDALRSQKPKEPPRPE